MANEVLIKELVKSLKIVVSQSKNINIDYIINQFKKNPSIYLYYPYLFSQVFENENNDDLKNISVSGFLYYLNLLESDKFLDYKDLNKIENSKDKIFLIQSLSELSIKQLTLIFKENEDFWSFWENRKSEYFESKYLEDKISYENFSISLYEEIADKKTSFAKIAIDVNYILSSSKNKSIHEKLLESHKLFSIGLQIIDDIADIRKDYLDDQFNYAILKIFENFGFNSKIDNEILEKFYYDGYAISLYNEAISYLDNAITILKDIDNISHWLKVIEFKKFECHEKIKVFNVYSQINMELSSNSFNKIKNLNSDFNESLNQSIFLGLNYLKSKFKLNKWEEYATQAGISNVWASSFIGYNLLEIDEKYKSNISQVLFDLESYLSSEKLKWGFNQNWEMEDADTINFCLLFLSNKNFNLKDKLEKLLQFQNPNGGFSTYNNVENLNSGLYGENFLNFDGWLQSHDCVSSLSLNVLNNYKFEYKNEFLEVKNYLVSKLNDNSINSYWWTDDIYSIFYTLNQLHKINEEEVLVNKYLAKIAEKQNSNGSYSDEFGENIFYTSYLIKCLCLDKKKYNQNILKAIDYLLNNQYDDGSWENSSSLRIPSPDVILPNNTNFATVKSFGTNIRGLEFKRLFTTALAINAIDTYSKTI